MYKQLNMEKSVHIHPNYSMLTRKDCVDVGCFVDSCGECEYSLSGEEQYCTKGVISTYNSLDYDGTPTYGEYSQKIVVVEGLVVRFPDGLNLDVASLLLCAGIS
jgi:uncharacterized zinc-type alcohol dehydrogenase-like protein